MAQLVPPARRRFLAASLVALLALPAPLVASSTPWDAPPSPPGAKPGKDAAAGSEEAKDKEKPFAEVIRGAEEIPGLFSIYRKEERFWLEVRPDQLGRDFLCSPTLTSGVGERGILAAQMLEEFVFTLRLSGKTVRLERRSVNYRADAGTPIGRAVASSFTDSVLASAGIESLPHPERKSVLVDLSKLLVRDIAQLEYWLESGYRLPYRLDKDLSAIAGIKGFPHNVAVESRLQYAIERLPVPPLGPSPQPQVPPPVAPPDARSLQLGVRYDLSSLPETGYRPRLADDRVGHFLASFQDFTDDTVETPYVRYVTRWNLEKADAKAALAPPREPIVFWLENTIPEKHRAAIRAGILLWNRAFERIGFQDAIVVKQQPDDADWDPADVRYNTVRWFVSTDAAFAIGPSRANPFTGEIYDADIGFAEAMSRLKYREYEELSGPVRGGAALPGPGPAGAGRGDCRLAEGIVEQASFGLDLLQATGRLATPEEEERYVRDYLVHVAAHEVGHTLGLRHNFRASTLHATRRLQDTALTATTGITASVMDYTPVNLAPAGSAQGEYWQTTLGPYDYWAIEYAYRPLDAATPGDERAALAAIAARGADPTLAYGTDDDAFGTSPVGIDPRTNQWDLGSDPLAYHAGRAALVKQLWAELEVKLARPGEGWQALRRAFGRGLNVLRQSMLNTSKYVGGIHHHRDHVGDPAGRPPYQPVAAREQRQALALLTEHLFGPGAFHFQPGLLNRLAIERFASFGEDPYRDRRLDFSIHEPVLAVQEAVLDRLYHPLTLGRLQDLEGRYADAQQAFGMADLFRGLEESIWSEIGPSAPAGTKLRIDGFRRGLQRAELRRLATLLLAPAGGTPEDATTLARWRLTRLAPRLRRTLDVGGSGLDVTTRAHLEETLARIDGALAARPERTLR